MRETAPILALFWLSVSAAGQVQPRYIASRHVVLAFGSGNGVERVETWLTTDEGQSWTSAESPRIANGAVQFEAERDGRFGFYLVLENAAGRSAEPPAAGTGPHITVIVDTAPPTLQVRQAAIKSRDEAATIDLRLTLIEENLSPGGLRLFHRVRADEPWIDGGSLGIPARPDGAAEAQVSWPIPADIAARVNLLLVCTDRAGNVAREEVLGVGTARRQIAPKVGIAGADGSQTKPKVDAEAETEKRAAASESDSRRIGDIARAEQMRTLAGQFLAEGRFDLAAARFSDALAEAPDDPRLLTEYGAALVRTNRLEDARQRFDAALAAAPKNTAALEGLAMVALGQQRLPDARDTLKRALQIDGGAGRIWLRYGDVEYRMGNQAAAFDAWKKAGGSAGDVQLQASARERLKSLQK